jgi:hypothetical protein
MRLSTFFFLPRSADTYAADSRRVKRRRAKCDWNSRPADKDVSQLDHPTDTLMTLITPCDVPARSPWHFVTGLMVVVTVYVIVVALTKWYVS